MRNTFNLAAFFIALGGLLQMLPVTASAAEISFSSGGKSNQLIELYTSEGCSSCPPADRWLSSLKQDESLWAEFVPIDFHVDYWDRLGWRDRFADSAYSQRQRQYARDYGEPTVYTPGVRRDGAEWRGWRRWHLEQNNSNPFPSRIEVGELRLSVDDLGEYTAEFAPIGNKQSLGQYTLNLAILGMGLTSEIQRGENRGKTLRHDFVVLAHEATAGDVEESVGESADVQLWSGHLPRPITDAPSYALAVWVTQTAFGRNSSTSPLTPIQATGGYLPFSPK